MASSEIQIDSTCGSLLRELQHIWDEIGESDAERDKMLLQLEQECLEVYRRKVQQASHARARLDQALSDAEAEISSLISILGDRSSPGRSEKRGFTLKEQLAAVQPQLEELRKERKERVDQFEEVQTQIQKVLTEISGSSQLGDAAIFTSESERDLSLERLDQFYAHLQALQNEKAERLQKVTNHVGAIHELCRVMDMDSPKIVKEVHPSLTKTSVGHSKSISDTTLDRLKLAVQSLQLERKKRLHRLQDLGTSLIELWNLMDAPREQREPFEHIISVIGATENELSAVGVLSTDNLQQAEDEVRRLDQLKSSKMKELVMKQQAELDEIYREAHIFPDPETALDKIMIIIDSGLFDASELLARMDQLISNAKEEALGRKDILEKMEKWVVACEEESWLEDYNRDENRYNTSRGAHINLKRAEKARATVQKLPSLVDALMTKVKAWEEERGTSFLYDGMRLLDILDEHTLLRNEKEQERRRMRDQKRLQEQLMTEQETLFGSKPSPNKPLSAKKGLSIRANGNSPAVNPNRRISFCGTDAMTKKNGVTPGRAGKDLKKDKIRPIAPVNYVSLPKEDSISLSTVDN